MLTNDIIAIALLCLSMGIGVVLIATIYRNVWVNTLLFKEIFNEANVAILVIDHIGNIIQCNPQAVKILGSPSVADTMAINVLTDDHLKQSGLSRVFEEVFEHGAPFRIERDYTSKWGKQSYLNIHILPISHKLVMVLAEDLTELEEQRQDAHRQYMFLRQIIDATHDWIYVRDRNHRFVLVNQEFADALGKPMEAIVGKSDEDFFDDETKTNLIKIEDRTVMDNRSTVQLGEKQLIDYRTGQRKWFRISKYPIRTNGAVEYVLGVATDVTQEKALTEALKVSERRYSELVETVNTLTMQISTEGLIVYASHASKQLLCQDPNRLIGKEWWEIIHPDDQETARRNFNRWRYMATRHRETMEAKVVGCNNVLMSIHWTVSILHENSRFKGLNIMGTDITHRKELESQLRESREAYKQLTLNYQRFFGADDEG